MKFLKNKEFFGYFLAAGSGVIVQYVVGSFICQGLLKMQFGRSIGIGFIASVPVGFILSKNIAFDSKKSGKTNREIFKYSISLIVSFFVTVGGSNLCLLVLNFFFKDGNIVLPFINYHFNVIGTFSHFFGMGLSFMVNFFVHRHFTFTSTGLFNKVFDQKN
ncbi:MAG: GtrA family protein [Leadbetterella sp.]